VNEEKPRSTPWLIFGAGVLLGLLWVGSARAQPPPGKSAASREFLIEGTGGAFEVPVHPDFVTVLYFPDSVVKAQASDKKNFTISAMGDTISLRPTTADTKTQANLNVATKSVKVTIILRVAAKPDLALAQVFFKKASEERTFRDRVEAEVARRIAGIKSDYEAKLDAMPAHIRKRADRELADRMLRRHETVRLRAIERNDANVIVRAKRAAFAGSDAYLFFEIQNRSGRVYRLGRVEVKRGTENLAALVRLESTPGKAERGVLGAVPSASRRRGVVVIRDADRLGGKAFTLVVAGPGGKNEVRVAGIRLR